MRAILLSLVSIVMVHSLSPVILIPGLGGSVFKAKLNGAEAPHVWCDTQSDWFVTWLNLVELIPEQKDCLLSRMALNYDNSTGTYSNAKGVDLDTNVDFGGVGGVAYVDPSTKSVYPYFGPMIDNLTATLGYTVGADLHGAGYDWRLGPLGHTQEAAPGGFYTKLKALIEGTVSSNKAKAHLVTHSLGGPTTLAFLNNFVDQEWRDAHIETFIPLSSPWLGSIPEVVTEIGGNNLGEPIPHDYLRAVQQQAESGIITLPYGESWGTAPLVITPSRNFTAAQMPDMLQVLGHNQIFNIFQSLKNKKLMPEQLASPSVRTHVIYSTGVDTSTQFTFSKDFDTNTDTVPTSTLKGDGDGDVNLVSAQWAEKTWTGARVNATFWSVKGVKHADTVSDSAILGRIISIITGKL